MSSKKLGWKILLSGASLAAMGALTPAFAQNNTAAPAAGDQNSDEIVVTATGRTQALQDVPVAVTAVNHEQLEQSGVNNIIDLRQVTPNLRIGTGQSSSSGTAASIRGLGTGSDNPGFEAAVGVFIDGVYRARTGAAITDLADIERVEILRGPQGTLYGKNTTAGAISIVTAQPDFTPSMWLEGSAGDLNLLGTRYGGNLPLSQNLALRFDGTYRSRDGFIDDVTSGGTIDTTERWSGRLQALWDISDDASLRIIVDKAESNEACCGAVTLLDTSASAPFPFSLSAYLTQPGAILTPDPNFGTALSGIGFVGTAADPEGRRQTVSPNRNYGEQTDDRGISAQLDWDIRGMHLTSISSYRQWDADRNQDIDFSSMDRAYRDGLLVGVDSGTQEIRLQGETGRLNWLVGAFYGNERVTQTDTIRYGNQAGGYINNLLQLFDFSAVGAVDVNGPLPGTGDTVFGCTPGAPGPGTTCALDYAYGTFAATGGALGVNAVVPGTTGKLGGAIGAFSGGLTPISLAGAGQQADRWRIDTDSFALFTHDEFNISDNLVLTLGARWTRESKDMSANLAATQAACGIIRANQDAVYAALVYQRQADLNLPLGNAARTLADGFPGALILTCNPAVNDVQNGTYTRSFDDDAVTGVASLAYHVTPDIMTYASYSRGFKSGGFNIDRSGMAVNPWSTTTPLSAYAQSAALFLGLPTAPTFGAADLQFQPETIDAYEVGIKSTLFHSVTLNLAAFYEELHDYQLNAFNGFNFITRNVPEVISEGVELEAAAHPMQGLTLTGGLLYNDAHYNSTATFIGDTTPPIPNYNEVIPGERLSESPLWTVTGSVLYQMPIMDNLKLSFFGDGRWNSDYRLQTLGRNPNTDQEAYAIFDARVGLGGRDDRWALEVFVHNLTDQYYSLAAFGVPEQSLLSPVSGHEEGVFAAFPNEPRTVGVTLRARY